MRRGNLGVFSLTITKLSHGFSTGPLVGCNFDYG